MTRKDSSTPVKVRSTMLGEQMTILAGRHRYPVTILFSGRTPLLVFGDSLTPIDDPYRFGHFVTRAERRSFMRAYIADWDAHEDEWNAIPCSDCGQPGNPCACEVAE